MMGAEERLSPDETAYVCGLVAVRGLGNDGITKLLLKYGSAKVVAELQFEPMTPLERRAAMAIRSSKVGTLVAQGRRTVELVSQLGGRVITILDDEYPLGLSQLPSSPPALYILGGLQGSDVYAVSVVGTRQASEEGRRAAYKLASELVLKGITVLSGLARGIDTAAHKGALAGRGRTIAVIGTGLDYVYPPENKDLRDYILASGGAVVTQFPPGSPPRKWQFPMRNRLMSGMGQGTVVVEASQTSGAKLQAKYAAEQGRLLFLVKKQVENYRWAKELADKGRAIVVESVSDVTKHLRTTDKLVKVPARLEVVDSLT